MPIQQLKISQLLPLTAASQFVPGYVIDKLSESEKRFHIYVPNAITFIILDYAEELRVLLAAEKADFRKECRIIREATSDFLSRWRKNLKQVEQSEFRVITDRVKAAISMDLFILTMALDNDMMRLFPELEAHYVTSLAETVSFLCYLHATLDKQAFDAIRKSLPGAKEWFIDDAVFRINNACSDIASKICNGLKTNYSAVDKKNQISMAVSVIDNHLKALIL